MSGSFLMYRCQDFDFTAFFSSSLKNTSHTGEVILFLFFSINEPAKWRLKYCIEDIIFVHLRKGRLHVGQTKVNTLVRTLFAGLSSALQTDSLFNHYVCKRWVVSKNTSFFKTVQRAHL